MNHDSFRSLGLSDALLRGLQVLGYESPTPIQAQAIPHLLAGRDLLGIAQTGTGKTAAFALPLLQRLQEAGSPPRTRAPRALILAPTRELAVQIDREIDGFSRFLGLSHAALFGGVGAAPQIARLRRGLDVLVATPGRLLDLMQQGHADLGDVEVLVLDEADRLLDMGFVRDVRRIVRATPQARQSLLFSATMPAAVSTLAGEMLKRPERVEVSPENIAVERIRQRLIPVDTAGKRFVLEHLLLEPDVSRALVFTRTKHGANKVAKQLVAAGIGADAIHGNKSQSARQRALDNFKSGETRVLVATDIAARGIDVQGISHVINYDLPEEPESYVHRIGRTARAGSSGIAWSLCDPSERVRLRGIERLVGRIPTEEDVARGELAAAERPRALERPHTDGRRAETRPHTPDRGTAPPRRRAGGATVPGRTGGERSAATEQRSNGGNAGSGGRRRRSERQRTRRRSAG